MIRKTRLMSRAGVMLVCVEVFKGRTLVSTHLKVSTSAGGQTFTDLSKALDAFRALTRPHHDGPRLKAA